MNVKTVIPLALAVVLGLFAAMAAKNMMDKNKAHPAEMVRYTQVVVAKDNLAAGAQLKLEDLAIGKMAGDVPADAVYGNPGELTGRVLKTGIVRGQPVLEPFLTPKGTGSGLQAIVPPGMRAITIEVNDFSGVGGFLVPGCHVDVIATVTGDNNEMLSRTVVQNVNVQAVNSHLQPAAAPSDPPEALRSITIVATPKEVEAINLASATGRARFVLRASGDQTVPDSEGVTAAELRGVHRHNDPFADTHQVSMKPTTQPGDWSESRTRSISVIRAGVESETNVQLGMEDMKWMTGANQELAPAERD
jgi:pilus assembly protein CpaB